MNWVTEADGDSSKQKPYMAAVARWVLASSRQISAVWIGGWIIGAQFAAGIRPDQRLPSGPWRTSNKILSRGGATIPANPISRSASKLRVRSQHVDQRSVR